MSINFIEKVAKTLLNRQIILQKIVFSKNNEEHSITPFRNNQKYIFSLAYNNEKQKWLLNNNIIEKGKIYRIPLDNKIYKRSETSQKKRTTLFQKFLHYYSYPDFLKRTSYYIFYKIKNKKYANSSATKDLSKKVGGVTFECVSFNNKNLEFKCLDFGGIYDHHINTEFETYSGQVPVSYYSTEFTAYVFFKLWKNSKDISWYKAARDALSFSIRNLEPYTLIAFDHYEFKLMPLLCLYKESVDTEFEKEIEDLKLLDNLIYKEYSYEPVNVYAMRIANLLLLNSIGVNIENFEKKVSEYIDIIEKNTTKQGLIRDNFPPASFKNIDLTYHQYALACLGITLSENNINFSSRLNSIFNKALSFSKYIQRPDGHVSYFGRGTNNIYHLASFVYAESFFFDNNNSTFEKIIKLLNEYYDNKIGLPSCLNSEMEKLMGWNHCEVPYIGQTLFFLLKAMENSKKDLALKEPIDVENSDYLVIKNDIFHIVISKGSDTYSWCSGGHMVGYGGIASLSLYNTSVLGALDYSFEDNCWSTDIPNNDLSSSGDKTCEKISFNNNTINLIHRHVDILYTLTEKSLGSKYIFLRNYEDEDFEFSLAFFNKSVKLVLVKDNYVQVHLCKKSFSFVLNSSFRELKLSIKTHKSNPFGILNKIYIKNFKCNKNDKLEWKLVSDDKIS